MMAMAAESTTSAPEEYFKIVSWSIVPGMVVTFLIPFQELKKIITELEPQGAED
ncbi:hypothetical protein [Mandarin fish ranavirus]|nr:hypothetical protein [Mandarin fish ranavirus]